MGTDSTSRVEYQRGDVVWSVDPFKTGVSSQRLWLIISTERYPFHPEQYVAAAITTTPRLISHPLPEGYWEVGGTPKPSYVSPWSIHSPREEDFEAPPTYPSIDDPWQGRLKQSFVDRVVDEMVHYVR